MNKYNTIFSNREEAEFCAEWNQDHEDDGWSYYVQQVGENAFVVWADDNNGYRTTL